MTQDSQPVCSHSANAHKSLSWARLKPEAGDSIRNLFHRWQGPNYMTCCSLEYTSAGSWNQEHSLRIQKLPPTFALNCWSLGWPHHLGQRSHSRCLYCQQLCLGLAPSSNSQNVTRGRGYPWSSTGPHKVSDTSPCNRLLDTHRVFLRSRLSLQPAQRLHISWCSSTQIYRIRDKQLLLTE